MLLILFLFAFLRTGGEIKALDIFHALVHLKAQLEREMNIAEKDILLAASSAPMYGTLFCIRHLMHLVTDFR